MKRSAIYQALILTGVLPLSGVSYAQQAGNQAQADERVEKISVTGSRIKRTDMETASPVTVLSADQIAVSGISNVENLLQEMSFSAGVAGNATNAYWTSGGYGTAQVNLRGLGVKRTLVLLNGRRVVGGGTGANSSVDLNMIPTSIIERIEVLKDGSSAVYGADAVAGVVNIITKQEFQGAEFNLKAGMAAEGDGENQDMSLTLGGSFDRGSSITSINYSNTEAVRQSDRIECSKAGTPDGTLECFGSSTTEGGRALLADGSSVQFNQNPDTANHGDDYGPYNSAEHGFKYISYLNAVSPIERFNISNFTRYEVTDSSSLFLEAIYTKRKGEQIVTPRAIRPVMVDADFRYNPTGQDLEITRRRNTELGAPYFFQETDTVRAVLGIEGELSNNWSWDVAFNFGRNTATDGWTFDLDNAKVAHTLDDSICTYDNSNGIPCGDWFGVNELTPEVIDYVKYRREGTGGNQMRSWTANLYGDLMELPAGTLAFAAGVERRAEKGWRDPDSTVLRNGAEEAIAGSYKVSEAYMELSVPLLAGVPLVEELTAEIAARYSDYDTVGGKSTYKLGLTWRVDESLMLRGVRSTAFRAPVITELFGGTNGENLRTIDPCENASGTILQNCLADGVPADFVQDGNTILTNVGGNPNLGAETADTFTLGVVWEPKFVESLSATLDYFDIQLDDSITSVNGSDQLKLCYEDPVGNARFCDTFTRHPVSKQVVTIEQRPVNAAVESVRGVDLNLMYGFELMGWQARTNLEATRLIEHERIPFAGQPTIDLLGYITEDQGSYTEWRGNLSFSMRKGDWSGTYSLRYIGPADDVNATEADPLGMAVGSVSYSDIQASYLVTPQLKISAGVDNLFDKKAPYLTSWNDANTDVMTYDLLGRRGYVSVNYQF